MIRYDRLIRKAAVAAVVALLTSVSAVAQTPTWTVSSTNAIAGSGVVLTLSLSDTTGIAGANCTVKLDNNDLLTFEKYDGTNISETAAANSAWQKDESLVSPTEFRFVMYDWNTPPEALDAGTDVVMAKIHLRVNPAAAADATARVWLDNGVDRSVTPNIGLTRLGDANAVSITPDVNAGTVTVVPALPPGALDFSGALPSGWSITQVRDTFDDSGNPPMMAVDPGVAMGLKVTNPIDTFGYYTGPLGDVPPVNQDNILLRANWTVSSSESDPADAPAFRLRLNADDGSVAETVEVQSSDTIQGQRLSPGTTPKVYSEYFMESASARNSIPSTLPAGYGLGFDLEAFDPRFTGPEGATIWLHSIEINAALLGNVTPTLVRVYDFTRTYSQTLGWTPTVPPTLYGLDGTAFANSITATANSGLILASQNTPHSAPDDKFSFGFWTWYPVALTASDTDLYRLKTTIASMTSDVTKTPHFRIRINSVDGQWTRHYEVIRKDLDSTMAPSAAGTEYDVYFHYPVELNNVPVTVSLDQINDRPEDDPNGSLKMLTVRLEQIQMPIFN